MMHRALVAGHSLRALRPVPLESLPRSVPRMFVKVEDYVFYEHYGIDWKAIRDAWAINRRLGYVYYGGSTITQQLARTLFLVPDRTYLRKYLEALASLEIELLLPKQRILELYVNTIEFGKGVFGIEAAARHYYGRSARDLSRDTAAMREALVLWLTVCRDMLLLNSGSATRIVNLDWQETLGQLAERSSVRQAGEMVLRLHEQTQHLPGFAMASCGGLHGDLPLANLEAYFDVRAEIGVTPGDWRTRRRKAGG